LVDGHFVTVAPKTSQRFGRITSLSIDSSGTAWLTDYQFGIMRLRDGMLAPIDTLVKLERRPVRAFVDRADRVWLRFGEGQLGQLTPDGRVSMHDVGLAGAIAVISEDQDGALWIGGDNGIARFTRGQAVAITSSANGYPGSHVTSLIADERGAIWAGTSAG